MFDKNLLGNNISDIDKNLLAQTISKIDLFFAKFGVNIDYDNSRELFENLKIIPCRPFQIFKSLKFHFFLSLMISSTSASYFLNASDWNSE